ncbi:MAG: tautomerase family protein [Treponema sp.]|jgi:phenylpyruvate tautomerase PptA (4-oxalocrotonate tautomerase family)|nr:tautomerase family protein [Treponema sp.]
MPYIAINTTEKLPAAKQEAIKTAIGSLISIIPTKTEGGLLIDFSGDHRFYRAGALVTGAYIEVRLYRSSDFGAKKKFTEEVFSLLSRELGIEKDHMQLNIIELENWGGGGTLK